MPPQPPSKEQQLFAAITEGNEAEAIRLIEDGASLTKIGGPDSVNPLHYAIIKKAWNVFIALVNKGAKITYNDFHYLIDNLANDEPVNVEPIRTVFDKNPYLFLRCNQASDAEDSLWNVVFKGSEDFIKAFINIVKGKNGTALTKPDGLKMPLLVALLSDGDEAAIIAGIKHLIAAAGINVAFPKNKDNPITTLVLAYDNVTIENGTFSVRFLKRCQAVGYDINAPIYAFSQHNPNAISALLYGLIMTKGIIFKYKTDTEPVRTDPETDVLSYLLDNTPRFITHYDSFISSGLLEMRPQIMLRLLMKLKSASKLDDAMFLASQRIKIHAYITNQAAKGNLYIINEIIKLWPAVINAQLNNDVYLSYRYTFLIHEAAKHREFEMVRRLLELGADPKLVDSAGKNACQYAHGSPEFESLVCRPKAPFRGLTRGNISKYNYIFNRNAGTAPRSVAENYSFCPVCLKDAERTVACNHMQHNCTIDSPDTYHYELYDRCKDSKGNVHWCTLCGRVCAGESQQGNYSFIHYTIQDAKTVMDGEGKIHRQTGADIQGNPYTHDCSATVDATGNPIPLEEQSFGGGIREKFLRIHRLREYAYHIRSANLPMREAYKRLIEQVWNAPLVAKYMNRPDLENIKGPNTWNIPTSAFKANVANVEDRPKPPTAQYADVKRGVCESVETEILESGYNAVEMEEISADNKGCQFHHMEEKQSPTNVPKMNNHDGEGQQFTIRTVENTIRGYNGASGTEGFGKCVDPTACKALIYPGDLEPLLAHGFDRAVYETYQELFNWRFGGARLAEGLKPGGQPGPALALIEVPGAGMAGGWQKMSEVHFLTNRRKKRHITRRLKRSKRFTRRYSSKSNA